MRRTPLRGSLRSTGGWDWAPSRRSPGTREHHFIGTNLKPRQVPKSAPTPTSKVHALLGGFLILRFYLAFNKFNDLIKCFTILFVDTYSKNPVVVFVVKN